MADEIITFDEILADPIYKSEFDRRVTKALSTVQGKLDAEVKKSKELLERLGVAGEGETLESLKQEISDLKAKYDKDVGNLTSQLADRDYSDAISRAISGKELKFTSKSAERAFTAALREKKLAVKDGELEGLDEFIKAQREADPDAFASDKPVPRIVTSSGRGGAPQPPMSRAAEIAKRMNESLYGSPKKE